MNFIINLFKKQNIIEYFLYIQYYIPNVIIRLLIKYLLKFTDIKENNDRENYIINKIKESTKTTYEVEKANEPDGLKIYSLEYIFNADRFRSK